MNHIYFRHTWADVSYFWSNLSICSFSLFYLLICTQYLLLTPESCCHKQLSQV